MNPTALGPLIEALDAFWTRRVRDCGPPPLARLLERLRAGRDAVLHDPPANDQNFHRLEIWSRTVAAAPTRFDIDCETVAAAGGELVVVEVLVSTIVPVLEAVRWTYRVHEDGYADASESDASAELAERVEGLGWSVVPKSELLAVAPDYGRTPPLGASAPPTLRDYVFPGNYT